MTMTTTTSASATTAIINLTQHKATVEQLAAGVIDFPAETREEISKLLTFEECPTSDDINHRVIKLMRHVRAAAKEHDTVIVMIGGANFLMPHLYRELTSFGFKPCFAFTKRVSSEHVKADGTVEKTSSFRHVGLVW